MDDHPAPDPVMKAARVLMTAAAASESARATSWYRVREIAGIFNVDDSTVYRWISKGSLRAHRFEDTIRVAPEDFEAFRRRSVIRPVGDLEAPEAVA